MTGCYYCDTTIYRRSWYRITEYISLKLNLMHMSFDVEKQLLRVSFSDQLVQAHDTYLLVHWKNMCVNWVMRLSKLSTDCKVFIDFHLITFPAYFQDVATFCSDMKLLQLLLFYKAYIWIILASEINLTAWVILLYENSNIYRQP